MRKKITQMAEILHYKKSRQILSLYHCTRLKHNQQHYLSWWGFLLVRIRTCRVLSLGSNPACTCISLDSNNSPWKSQNIEISWHERNAWGSHFEVVRRDFCHFEGSSKRSRSMPGYGQPPGWKNSYCTSESSSPMMAYHIPWGWLWTGLECWGIAWQSFFWNSENKLTWIIFKLWRVPSNYAEMSVSTR